MAHLVLHDVDPTVIVELLRRAEPHGRTIEDEAKAVLEEALGLSSARSLQAARRIRSELAGSGGQFADSAAVLREETGTESAELPFRSLPWRARARNTTGSPVPRKRVRSTPTKTARSPAKSA